MTINQSKIFASRAWIWMSILGVVIGFIVYIILRPLVIRIPNDYFLVLTILSVIAIGPLGVFQALTLPKSIRHSSWWIATTALGALLWCLTSFFIGFPTLIMGELFYGFTVFTGAWLGAIIGSVQWVILRQTSRQAWQWIPANALAFSVAMPIFSGLFVAVDVGFLRIPIQIILAIGSSCLGAALAGLIIGTVTYVALGLILGTKPVDDLH